MKNFLLLFLIVLLTGLSAAGCSAGTEPDADVDVDLTALSTTMAQAEFQNILSNQGDYLGKTIKVRGQYYSLIIDRTGNHHHYVIVVPGDECCMMGFEFKLSGDYTYPDDYPEQKVMIEVTGTLERYEELGNSYLHLAAADMNVLN